ncbi:hypothetical protein O6H91_03G041800 [Diphasiastrum complanatum]|uniref:Uncharacterized protein n=1 Tax=Diphasiastrum complanatum TaxID=34168 RepID=A0ACC2E5S1_DIPCM|nr:hypothetical protein O6H91_03G041800 [Diphasiastrum complanatum]
MGAEAMEKEGMKSASGSRAWLRNGIILSALVTLLAVSVAGTRGPLLLLPSFFRSSIIPSKESSCTCQVQKLKGVVEDCCCDYETVDAINNELLHPVLQQLVKKPFFRYFKAKLWCDCPFWPDDGMCHMRDCSVCECPDSEFPEMFKGLPKQLSFEDPKCQEGKPEAAVDRTLDRKVFHGWSEVDNPWTYDDETDNGQMTYVNLLLNPERYTGYTGTSAQRIWKAIYEENCFKDGQNDSCTERRVFYKLISGLHASISTHIAVEYLLDEQSNHWGPNIPLFYERVLKFPERVQNLYFTYLFILRAVTKAADFLSQADYNTGNDIEDNETLSLILKILRSKTLQEACPMPFDEAQMWRGADGIQLKTQIQQHFRKISALMDCVGCEKCRLWGKLQILGLGTALKILFSVDVSDSHTNPLDLQHNEVIALINLLSRLSESLQYIHKMSPLVDVL